MASTVHKLPEVSFCPSCALVTAKDNIMLTKEDVLMLPINTSKKVFE
jgi:hypothetical protein